MERAVFFEIMIMLARKALKARMAGSGNKDSARNICLYTKAQKTGLTNGVVEMPLRTLFFITYWKLGLQTEKELESLMKKHYPAQTN